MKGNYDLFTHWVRQRGPTLTAFEVGVTVRAVWYWIYGEAQPRMDTAKKLVDLGKGTFTLEDVYANEPKPRHP